MAEVPGSWPGVGGRKEECFHVSPSGEAGRGGGCSAGGPGRRQSKTWPTFDWRIGRTTVRMWGMLGGRTGWAGLGGWRRRGVRT